MKLERHRWVKVRDHVRICRKCGCGRVTEHLGGKNYQTRYHLPDGNSLVLHRTPTCEVGPKTQKYLDKYAEAIAAAAAKRIPHVDVPTAAEAHP